MPDKFSHDQVEAVNELLNDLEFWQDQREDGDDKIRSRMTTSAMVHHMPGLFKRIDDAQRADQGRLGAMRMIMKVTICIWVMSLVVRVIRDAVENFSNSAWEKFSAFKDRRADIARSPRLFWRQKRQSGKLSGQQMLPHHFHACAEDVTGLGLLGVNRDGRIPGDSADSQLTQMVPSSVERC